MTAISKGSRKSRVALSLVDCRHQAELPARPNPPAMCSVLPREISVSRTMIKFVRWDGDCAAVVPPGGGPRVASSVPLSHFFEARARSNSLENVGEISKNENACQQQRGKHEVPAQIFDHSE